MDEIARLHSLKNLALDRIKQPEVFERITRLAAETLASPIAAISIIEEDREWFLAQIGLPFSEFTRDHSMCSAALAKGEPLIIENADQDPRFMASPLVREPTSQRSYIGIPLANEDGALLGTLWCASPLAKAFETSDIARLKTLAQLTEQCLIARAKTLELARANSSLLELNQLFKQAETAAQIGSWRVDLKANELNWSDQVFAIHGLPQNTPLSVAGAIGYYAEADQAFVAETIDRVLLTGEPFSYEAAIQRADGETRRIRAMGERIDVDGVPEALAGVFIDCTEEHKQTIALQHAATHDALTGLVNRSEFDRRLSEALKERKSQGPDCALVVMLMDLDGFKDVNDRLGHLVGDKLLSQISHTLAKSVDDELLLARWGGDEFALLFPVGCSLEEAKFIAETLIEGLATQINIDANTIRVSATGGMAQMKDDAAAEELMRRADLTLYHGKANARGRVHCWSREIEAVQVSRQAAMTMLSEALDTGRAFATYQPIVDLETEAVVSVEALLRLRDISGRVVSAGEFFPALCDPFMARRVARFMLDQIMEEAPGILELFGPRTRIGINVSEADLSQGDFLAEIKDLIARSVLAPENIVLEVTETMLLLDEAGRICDLLKSLDALGCTVALDDFGTGFSSLTHLRDFPIRKVKIDKEFISAMSHDHQSRLIVQAMVQMAHSLDIRTVAEGVETEEQHVFLRSIGCSHGQGFKFARPRALADMQGEYAMRKAAPEARRNVA